MVRVKWFYTCVKLDLGYVVVSSFTWSFILLLIFPGECKARFTSRKVPYCIKYHPEDDKQHLFVAGTSDKKIVCVSKH